jgi:hypothetical protein
MKPPGPPGREPAAPHRPATSRGPRPPGGQAAFSNTAT